MRKLVSAVALLLVVMAAQVQAQPFTAEIIRTAPLGKDALFNHAVVWIAEAYRSANEVIQAKDEELGTIIGNGAFDMNVSAISLLPVTMPVTYKFRIDVRDQRYRMTFSDVRLLVSGGHRPIEDSNRESNERRVREHFEQLANSFDAYLTKAGKDF